MEKKSEVNFGEIGKFAWSYVDKRPGRFFLAVIGLFGGAAMDLLTPVIFGELVDFLSENADAPVEAFEGALIYVGYLMLAGILFWFFRHGSWFFWARIVARGMRKLTEDSLYRVQRFSTDWHENSFAGATVTKIKRGMRGFQSFIDLFYYQFTPLTLVVVGMAVIVSIKYLWLGLVISIGMILYAIYSVYIALKYVMPSSIVENIHDTRVGAQLADTVSCNATVKAFAKEKEEDRLFSRVTKGFEKYSLRAWFLGEYMNISQNFLMTLFKFSFLLMGVWLWSREVFTVGDFVFAFASYRLIAAHLRQIGDHIRRLQMAASDMEDVVKFSKQDFEIKDKKGAKALRVTKGGIVFDGVGFAYKNSMGDIFSNLSVEIKPGEKVALVGHSGSGKSTFVKLLQRLFDIQKGQILVDGQDIRDVTLASLRESMVLVPQEPILFHRSLRDNIAYGKPEASERAIKGAAKKAYLDDFIRNTKEGYETFVGERGVKLSGGERQRVAIARAILTESPILIFDEATSSLDSVSEKYIQDAIEELVKDRTSIIIAHRLSTIKQADRILVFEGGKIVEEGTHGSLMRRKNGVYRELYEMQVGGFIA